MPKPNPQKKRVKVRVEGPKKDHAQRGKAERKRGGVVTNVKGASAAKLKQFAWVGETKKKTTKLAQSHWEKKKR